MSVSGRVIRAATFAGRRGRGRLTAALAGALAAALPGVAAAQEGLRELETPADATQAVAFAVLGVLVLFGVSSIGFLYRRQRRLRWDYQLPEGWLSEGHGVDPDAEHGAHSGAASGQ